MGNDEKKKINWKEWIKQIGMDKLIIMLLAGIVLIALSLPGSSKNSSKGEVIKTTEAVTTQINQSDEAYIQALENKLSNALTKVDGIGKVEVMITIKGSKERVINKDTPLEEETVTEEDSTGGKRESSSRKSQEETILVQDENGNNVPYVIQEKEPEIAGVVVIASGGGSQAIINEITDAVEVLFSVPAHKIKVMKMND